MDYKLCKKLKDVGFPQPNSVEALRDGRLLKDVPIPTLSELIEACGDRFVSLRLIESGLMPEDEKWKVRGIVGEDGDGEPLYAINFYESPEIAVANLYIKLNE